MVALHFRDALITFTFPGGDRVLFIPGGKQLSLLAGKIQLIAVAHIEVGAGDGAASAGRGSAILSLKSTFMVHWPYWPSPPLHWLYIKLPRSPFTSPTAGCRLCISLSILRYSGSLAQFLRPPPASTDADGRTAMPALRAPIQPGWRGSHFYALYSRRIPNR